MEAGETTKAADLVARHGIAALAAGEALRALHWIRLLPNDIVRSSPDHCVIAAWSHSLVEQYDAIAGYASRALESLGEGQRPFTYVGHVELHVRALLAGAAHLDGQDPRGTLRMLDEVLAATPADDLLLRASVAIMRGKVLAFDGRYEEGIAAHGQAHACGERAGSELLQMAACTGKAEALLLQGRLREAIAVADQELEDGSGATEILGSQVANLHAIMSLAYLERNELDRCEAAVGRAAAAVGVRADSSRAWSEIVRLGKVRFTAFHSTSPRALYALAARLGLLRRRGRNDEADRLLKQVETAAGSSISVATSQILHTLRHRLRHGRREGLKRPPRTPSPEHGIDVPTGCSYWDVATSIARARSLLESGDATSAEAELARTTLQDREPNLAHAEALVLRARILVALARRAEAERAVDAALEASAPEHRAGVWTDAGEAAIPLLESAVARGCAADEALSFASRVLVMLRQQAPASAEAASSASLSERELAVLRLLAAGRNNREIADALFLAIGTVKKHTHNIYGKLQVTSRTQAILAGRRQGIIA
jgi:LuxR family maltose regulon positive regulatory protein